MWFFFGFITIGVAAVSSLLYRLSVSWHGEVLRTQGVLYEYAARIVKGRVLSIRVGVTCHAAYRFTLKPEGSFDQFSKEIGLTKECQTGDAKFDDAIYVLSDDLALHRKLQLDAELRANILRLLKACEGDGRLREINAYNGRLWVVVKPSSTDEDEAVRTGELIVPSLHHLAGDFATTSEAASIGRDPFPFRAACMLAISTGLAINGGITLVRTVPGDFPFMPDIFAPLPAALSISAVGVVALMVLTLWLVGRSARAHLVLIELLLVASFGVSATAYGELRDYNMEFDRQTELRYASVAGTYDTYTHSRRSSSKTRHCHVRMIGWPEPERESTREMSCNFADALLHGTELEILTHPGALGWTWVSDIRLR